MVQRLLSKEVVLIAEPAVRQIDENQLVRSAQTDPEAFDRLYRHYVQDVYRYCVSQTRTQADAEDLTAQIFLAALEGIHRYRGRGEFAAWLFGIVRRKCADYQRQHYRNQEEGMETAVSLPHPARSPDDQTHRRRIIGCLQKALDQISPDRREAILLRFWGGLSVRETAVVMGRTQAAVKMLVSRAVSDLKERCWHYEMD
jgi:RNA polymerase sigma-70 factor, ECF subfamily